MSAYFSENPICLPAEGEVDKGMTKQRSRYAKILDDEIRLSVSEKLYSKVTEILHRCRDVANFTFVFDIGYIFSGWKNLGVDILMDRLKRKWESARNGYKRPLTSVKDIPVMVEGPAFESMRLSSNSNTHEKRNREIYEKVKKKDREFVLIAVIEINIIKSKPYGTKHMQLNESFFTEKQHLLMWFAT